MQRSEGRQPQPGAPRSWRGQEGSPQGLHGPLALSIPRLWPSGLQNCGTINACSFDTTSVWPALLKPQGTDTSLNTQGRRSPLWRQETSQYLAKSRAALCARYRHRRPWRRLQGTGGPCDRLPLPPPPRPRQTEGWTAAASWGAGWSVPAPARALSPRTVLSVIFSLAETQLNCGRPGRRISGF